MCISASHMAATPPPRHCTISTSMLLAYRSSEHTTALLPDFRTTEAMLSAPEETQVTMKKTIPIPQIEEKVRGWMALVQVFERSHILVSQRDPAISCRRFVFFDLDVRRILINEKFVVADLIATEAYKNTLVLLPPPHPKDIKTMQTLISPNNTILNNIPYMLNLIHVSPHYYRAKILITIEDGTSSIDAVAYGQEAEKLIQKTGLQLQHANEQPDGENEIQNACVLALAAQSTTKNGTLASKPQTRRSLNFKANKNAINDVES
ncbi:UDP-N-acetylmuramoylalanine--D-glutamate ligase [Striga asiatica]|uniref:UDP-N-acetylmuramoylalanine--D-glutamate ligase n=1 Tax=Striga asiatica TaxID=4170 RepID=A0A5A7P3P5_STRAF|nr:UDP-N-acetylmuramoylalanine--D-glutamate ligase [Striga asiatica]